VNGSNSSDVANALSNSSGSKSNSLSARDHCSDAVRQVRTLTQHSLHTQPHLPPFQMLASASVALEQASYDTALHIFTQAQQLSTQELEAAMQAPSASSSKQVQFPAPAVDLKMAQVGLGMALHGCASCHRALNNLPKAQECFTESLRVLTKGLGSHHPELASAWNNLGSLQSQLNRMPAALECYEHAADVLKAQSSRFGSLHLSKVAVPFPLFVCDCPDDE